MSIFELFLLGFTVKALVITEYNGLLCVAGLAMFTVFCVAG